MKARAAAFADGIKPLDRAFAVEVDLYSAAEVMCCGGHGDHIAGYVDAEREAFLVDIGEMTPGLVGILV